MPLSDMDFDDWPLDPQLRHRIEELYEVLQTPSKATPPLERHGEDCQPTRICHYMLSGSKALSEEDRGLYFGRTFRGSEGMGNWSNPPKSPQNALRPAMQNNSNSMKINL
jgi:hypothetical protein